MNTHCALGHGSFTFLAPQGGTGNYDYSMTICEGEKTAAVRVMEL